MIDDIALKIIEILDDLQENSEDVFVDVLDEATGKFNGWPSAVVLGPDDSDPKFLTNVHVEDNYEFMIYLYAEPDDNARQRVRHLQDIVIEAMNTSDDLGGLVSLLEPAKIVDLDKTLTGAGDNIISCISVSAKVVSTR